MAEQIPVLKPKDILREPARPSDFLKKPKGERKPLPRPDITIAPIAEKKPFKLFEQRAAVFLPGSAEFFERCGVDVSRVDPVPIGEGFTHTVFAYTPAEGPAKVVKVPKEQSKGLMSRGYEDDKENIALVKKFFGDYAANTEIRTDPETGKYVVLQDKIAGHAVTNNTETPAIRAQLSDLMRLNREMMRQTGHSLDFIGVPGFLSWVRHQARSIVTRKSVFEVSNILVQPDGKLKIIDFDVLRFKDVPRRQRMISNIGFFANRLTMRWYFGVDVKPKD